MASARMNASSKVEAGKLRSVRVRAGSPFSVLLATFFPILPFAFLFPAFFPGLRASRTDDVESRTDFWELVSSVFASASLSRSAIKCSTQYNCTVNTELRQKPLRHQANLAKADRLFII